MSESGAGTTEAGGGRSGPLPPYLVQKSFLDDQMVVRLLDYTLTHQNDFEATTLRGDRLDTSFRVSAFLRDLGPLKQELRSRLLPLTPALVAQLRVTPFEPEKIEVELVAHGDGAFYKQHIDTFTGRSEGQATQRLLSGVYYFHTRPKAFSGGALRLYAFGADETSGDFIDLEPEFNTLVVFPSWVSHEVRRVSCPSLRFADSRFAINFWFRRRKPVHQR